MDAKNDKIVKEIEKYISPTNHAIALLHENLENIDKMLSRFETEEYIDTLISSKSRFGYTGMRGIVVEGEEIYLCVDNITFPQSIYSVKEYFNLISIDNNNKIKLREGLISGFFNNATNFKFIELSDSKINLRLKTTNLKLSISTPSRSFPSGVFMQDEGQFYIFDNIIHNMKQINKTIKHEEIANILSKSVIYQQYLKLTQKV
jgi:hypothetical protein